jgi:hypothetical protein
MYISEFVTMQNIIEILFDLLLGFFSAKNFFFLILFTFLIFSFILLLFLIVLCFV